LFSFCFFIVSFIFVSPAFSLSSSSFVVHLNNNSLTINSRPPVPAALNTLVANFLASPTQPNGIFNARKDSGLLFRDCESILARWSAVFPDHSELNASIV
jgi:hypothetical protein